MSQPAADRGDVLRRALVEIRTLQAEIERLEDARHEPIAITGMACRLPGADDPDAAWRLLVEGRDATCAIPADRWEVDRYFDRDPDAAGRMYVRRGGFLADPWGFDARLFRLPPREAAEMDPQHRLLLEAAWQALEAAGTPPAELRGSRTGVFVGISNSDFAIGHPGFRDPARLTASVASGLPQSFAAGRLSYGFGLLGPSVALDTACSSSLVAAHLACQSLRLGECDRALVGGVSLLLSPFPFVALCRARMLAPDGRCKTFSAAADGYGRGEGVGVLVLRRLADVAPDEPIVALLHGSAVNQDGPSSGITVPSGAAQQILLREALQAARATPAEVGYVEAHGTGTSLGDPIELRALAAVLGAGRPPDRPLLVGSLKTNIGHLEAAAGVAGVIKAALALRHRRIPPHLHFDRPSPHLDWERAPLRVPVDVEPWPDDAPLCGVSGFGVSGTNAHLILGPAPARALAQGDAGAPAGARATPELICLSARHEAGLARLVAASRERLAEDAPRLSDLAHTTQRARTAHGTRRAVVASSLDELRDALARDVPPRTAAAIPRVAFLFPGQGSQAAGVGRGLLGFPAFRDAVARCDAALARLEAPTLTALLEGAASLEDTLAIQVLLCGLGVALTALWRAWGVTPELVLGHSVGEYAAMCAAGALDPEAALELVVARGRLMRGLPEDGAMLAVFAPEQVAAEAVNGREGALAVAAVNGPEETVLAGRRAALDEAARALAAAGVRTRALSVSHAFHSPLMDPILDAFEAQAARVPQRRAAIPWIANATAAPTVEADAAALRRHLRAPVRFAAGLAAAVAAGVDTFVELGPGATLLGLVRRVCGEAVAITPSLRAGREDGAAMLDAAGSLWAGGAPVALDAIRAGAPGRRIDWPVAPLGGERLGPPWEGVTREVAAGEAPPSLVARPLDSPALALASRIVHEARYDRARSPILGDHRVHGVAVVTGALQLATAEEAVAGALGWARPLEAETVEFIEPLILGEAEARTVQIVTTLTGGRARVEIVSRVPGVGWRTHTRATLHPRGELPEGPPEALAFLRARLPEHLTGDAFYARLWPAGLHEIGPSLRLVAELWRDGAGEALARIELPPEVGDTRAALVEAQARLMEACGQVIKAARPGDEAGVFVAGGARLTWIAPITGTAWCRARAVATADDPGFLGSFEVFDDAGRRRGGSDGLRFRPLGGAFLGARPAATGQPPVELVALLATEPARRDRAVLEALAGLIGGRLGVPAAELGADAALRELGVDSLLGVELRAAIAQAFSIELSAADLLDNPRLTDLAARVSARLPWPGALPGDEPAPGARAGDRPAPAAPARQGSWIAHQKPRRGQALRLFCLPFGGGAASVFQRWSEGLPETIEVCPVQLPGREERLHEPAFDAPGPLLDALEAHLGPWMDRPFALFGCSMGGLLAYELARRLERRGAPLRGLIVAAYPAPHLPNRYFDGLLDEALAPDARVERARALGVLPEPLLSDPDLLRTILPTLRADLSVVRRYVHEEGAPLACPLSVYGGARDAELPAETIAAWLRHAGGAFTLRMLDGPHLFLESHREAVLAAVAFDLIGGRSGVIS